MPSIGDSFQILSCYSRTGTFSPVYLPNLPADRQWEVQYVGTGVWLHVIPVSSGPGDFDADGDVDLDDYLYAADCLGGPNTLPSPTLYGVAVEDCLEVFDFNEDNDVDLDDAAYFFALFDEP
jgi:hypothetical protein